MNIADARRCLQELARRGIGPIEIQKTPNTGHYPYFDALFNHQKNFVLDSETMKTAVCTRRAGKTWLSASYLVYEAERWDNCEVAYITLTRKSAKELLWNKLVNLNKTYRLGLEPNKTDLTMTTKNGSIIYLKGAEDSSEMEKLRGHAFKVAIIDEAGSFGPHLEDMVYDVLEPTLLDGQGTIAMMGTPNAACVGKYHDVTTGVEAGWSNHAWTVYENPYIPHAKEWVQKNIIDKRGWTWDHPTVQREWLGKWVRSSDSLVYRFNEEINVFDGKYPNDSNFVLAIDLGYHDQTVFTVGAFSESTPEYMIIDGVGKSGMIVHEIAQQAHKFAEKFQFTAMVCDTGGLGKTIVEELNERYGLNIQPAEKKSKREYIEHFNSDLQTGKIKIASHLKQYISQIQVLQWDEKRRKEDERYKNDWCDSGLYNWREGKHWTYEEPQPELNVDSEEYMNEYWEKEARRLEREKETGERYDPTGVFGYDEEF